MVSSVCRHASQISRRLIIEVRCLSHRYKLTDSFFGIGLVNSWLVFCNKTSPLFFLDQRV